MPKTTLADQTPRLNVTSLSQYVRLENCERFLRFRLRPDEEKAFLKRWNLTIQPLTPLLQEAGAAFEQRVDRAVATTGEQVIDLDGKPVADTVAALAAVRKPTILLQPSVEGPIGNYLCHGRADIFRIERSRAGGLRLLIADVKASRHERMEHRLQIAVYARLIQSMAAQAGQTLAEIKGTVLHLQEDGSVPSLSGDLTYFDLETYLQIVDHLVIGADSVVERIAQRPFDEVTYHLSYKCDGCLYNAICMYDSAERLDLSLVPHLSAVEKRVLQSTGVTNLRQLAALMTLPDKDKGERDLQVARGQQAVVDSLTNLWPVGPNLPVLVQRARRALRRFDAQIESSSYLYGASYGTLPSDEEHPGLVKIFLDAQHDYLADRLYLVSALVVGPQGKFPVVRCTTKPPDDQREADLLIKWVAELIKTTRQAAGRDAAPVHLYCYNRYDQKVLLEAVKRHLDEVAALPAFFDLMTQTPALTQPIISFLFDELKERRNLGAVCMPLHDAARALGFDWQDEPHDYFRLFRARLFDNRRDMVRLPDGTLARADDSVPKGDPRRLTIEASSRFNSQIPLEYAYAAWKSLPRELTDDKTLDPFREITLDQLKAFATRRVLALAHIEQSFRFKARFLQKPLIQLPTLSAASGNEPPLSQSLQEFLFMEHHARLQASLLNYGLPIERRAQTGLALLLKYKRFENSRQVYCFAIEFKAIGLDPVLTMNAFRLKEGDWVVINPTDQPLSANQLKHGRLAIIRGVRAAEIDLELLAASFQQSKFRYYHKSDLAPVAGEFYTLDEMADDLNGDKVLEALQNTPGNVLYQWLLKRPKARTVPEQVTKILTTFINQVDALEKRTKPTPAQRAVIIGQPGEPAFLVQGPPGTGKSHTLAWAVLARVAVAAATGKPCRVIVSCKTHNAIKVVLGTLAEKLARLTGISTALTQPLKSLPIWKIVSDEGEECPTGVQSLNPYNNNAQARQALQQPLEIIGATPGGLYNLMRYTSGTKKVDWSARTFDLVVIDEASQMSLPEGVLASAFLKSDGQIIVVGDHRQMPPIIAHPWEEELKRSATAGEPYLSLFESLIARDFPRLGLDESFRLHETIAEFLQENIYVHDGLRFFSRRTEVLTQPPHTTQFVDRVLDPNYPLVVIEHGEQGSQQYNELEASLISPLIEVCANRLRLDGRDGLGVVVPHRAQKALLRERFPELAESNSIDTVERFQGGERDVIIVSATASDPDYVLAEASFLLNLNRLNVALSRPRKKLIVVASRSVVELLTSDLEVFENAAIWKRLYYQYARDMLWQGQISRVPVTLRGCPALAA